MKKIVCLISLVLCVLIASSPPGTAHAASFLGGPGDRASVLRMLQPVQWGGDVLLAGYTQEGDAPVGVLRGEPIPIAARWNAEEGVLWTYAPDESEGLGYFWILGELPGGQVALAHGRKIGLGASVVVLDADGQLVWSVLLPSTVSIAAVSQDHLYLFEDFFFRYPLGSATPMLTCADLSGMPLWSRAYLADPYNENDMVDFLALAVLKDGLLISGKALQWQGDCSFILKTDTQGNPLWCVETKGWGGFHTLVPLGDGSVLAAGNRSVSPTRGAIRVVRIRADGTLLWEQGIPKGCHILSIQPTNEGILVGGYFPESTRESDDYSLAIEGVGTLLWALDYDGTILWVRQLPNTLLGMVFAFRGITVDGMGEIHLVGQTPGGIRTIALSALQADAVWEVEEEGPAEGETWFYP